MYNLKGRDSKQNQRKKNITYHARKPDGRQITDVQTPQSDDSDSPCQAADNRNDDADNLGDDFKCSDDSDSDIPSPRRWATADSSLASRALDLIFKFPPTTEQGRIMKTEELMRMKSEFLDGFDASLREQAPPDIHLRPCNGPPLPAHKAVLSARSTFMVHPPPTFDAELMREYWSLGASSCETEIVNVPMSREALEALLDFLYHGSLDPERTEKHIAVLFFSAWKFDILYLSEFCAHRILSSLKPSNALKAFKIALGCSHRALLEAVLDFIVENMEEIAFSREYKQFVGECPKHSVRITQAFFMYGSTKRIKT